MKQARFMKAKIISLILVVCGIIGSVIVWVYGTKSWQDYSVRAHTYSFVNPISGETAHVSGSKIGELSLFQFAFSEYMNSAIWIEAIVFLIAFLVIALLFYAVYFNQELIVGDENIKGKAVKGKEINIPFAKMTSIKKSFLKGIVITTKGAEKIKFRFLKNQAEMIELISTKIEDCSSVANGFSGKPAESSADQLKKYKELFDCGAISEDEYEAQKKQILDL